MNIRRSSMSRPEGLQDSCKFSDSPSSVAYYHLPAVTVSQELVKTWCSSMTRGQQKSHWKVLAYFGPIEATAWPHMAPLKPSSFWVQKVVFIPACHDETIKKIKVHAWCWDVLVENTLTNQFHHSWPGCFAFVPRAR